MVLLDIFEHLHLTSTYIFSCIILKKDFPPKAYFNHENYFLIQWIHFLHLLSYIVVFIRMNIKKWSYYHKLSENLTIDN